MPDFAMGKIYSIRNRADNDKIVYIGSTTATLSNRMSDHRKDVTRRPQHKLYKLMTEVGVQHFYIELVADFPCERREQLFAEEGRHIRLLNMTSNGCNTYIAGRSDKEWRDTNRDKLKAKKQAYYIANRTQAIAKMKIRNDAHKMEDSDAILKKTHYDAHKAEISDVKKAKYQVNKAAILAQKKVYDDAHKAERAAKERQRRAIKKQAIINGGPEAIVP